MSIFNPLAQTLPLGTTTLIQLLIHLCDPLLEYLLQPLLVSDGLLTGQWPSLQHVRQVLYLGVLIVVEVVLGFFLGGRQLNLWELVFQLSLLVPLLGLLVEGESELGNEVGDRLNVLQMCSSFRHLTIDKVIQQVVQQLVRLLLLARGNYW